MFKALETLVYLTLPYLSELEMDGMAARGLLQG